MSEFKFKPASWVPFKDQEVMNRLAKMTPEELEKHPNPDVHIKVLENFGCVEAAEKFMYIKESFEQNKKFSTIFGNPNPNSHMPLAELINRNRIDCKNCVFVTMDEWADEDGNIAPPSYQSGFTYSFLKYFIQKIDPDLRPKEENVLYPTTENIKYYSDMIDEKTDGGIDFFTSGPGWAGHIAFIDPCPELIPNYGSGEEYIIKDTSDPYFQQPAQVVTLHPLTIAQNSLHGVFGQSGACGWVPPKAATIGPRDVLHGKKRVEGHDLTTGGSFSSWQRMTSRLITHGPVTPYVPGSIFQLMPTDIFLTPAIAAPFGVMEVVGY